MSFINISANMQLPVPIPGQEGGPKWALDVNSCMAILDGHNHSAGSGVQITPSGLNISSDLPMGGNSLLNTKALFLASQGTQLTTSNTGCVYRVNGDLWYNNGSGTAVQITTGGSVAGAAGSISGLPSSPVGAGVSWQNLAASFVFNGKGSNTSAVLDAGSIIIRNINVSSPNGVTLQAPLALGASYSLTLPTLPVVTNLMTLDTNGNIAAVTNVDNTTIEISSNNLQVKDGGITQAKLADGVLPSGAVQMFAGAAAPTGWLLCDGSAISRTTYAALFAAIGVAYGVGDNSTTFNIPDARGRTAVGAGTGGGLTARSLGQAFGEETHQLSIAEMPSHTHREQVGWSDNYALHQLVYGNGSNDIGLFYSAGYGLVLGGPAAGTGPVVTGNTGNDGAHNNMQPSFVVNYIIKT